MKLVSSVLWSAFLARCLSLSSLCFCLPRLYFIRTRVPKQQTTDEDVLRDEDSEAVQLYRAILLRNFKCADFETVESYSKYALYHFLIEGSIYGVITN